MTPPPRVLVAELTHRCPLRCAYCSNPEQLVTRELDSAVWTRLMREAGELGVWQAHLTGGEPLLYRDILPVAEAAAEAGLYPTLITSGVGATRPRVAALVAAGVRAVQVSFQDVEGSEAKKIAGRDRGDDKVRAARWAREVGASLTVNVVIHRGNIARLDRFVALALSLGADRLELAHVQIHGWALRSPALLPTAAQIDAADRLVAEAKVRHGGRLEILYVMPDLSRGRPKPCVGGWGRSTIVITPDGRFLPCHGAAQLPLQFDDAHRTHLADAWEGEAFAAFRGLDWMEAPCRTCPERTRDFGGCRCQAFHYTGRPTATDPACDRSPDHHKVLTLRRATAPIVLRGAPEAPPS